MGWACLADILLHELRMAMASRLGARTRAGIAVTSAIVSTPPRSSVEITQGDTSRLLRAALLIGADGNASPVRVAAGIPTDGYDYGQHALIARVEVSAPRKPIPPSNISPAKDRSP
jgi:2-octaprenylphenol hydroxylase